jgi:uncharacterized membrane protein
MKPKGMKKISIKILFNRHTLLWTCIILSVTSFYISVHYLKESNLNLFASSGAIMNVAGLLLTIKRTLVVLWTIPLEWATNCIKYGDGSSFGSENTPEDYKNTKNVIKDEKCGITLIILGTLIWAYASYIPSLINELKLV